MRRFTRRGGLWLALLSIGIAGCPGTPVDPGDGLVPPPSGSASTSEPNDNFSQAVALNVGSGQPMIFDGAVSTPSDVDVFNLGSVSVGDAVTVRLDATSGSLDPAIALFDQSERLIIENDDIDLGIDLSSLVDLAMRRSASPLFLVVTRSRFGSSSGNYLATITIQRGVGTSGAVGQEILLDFGGGSPGVSHPVELSEFIPPFSAEKIDPAYRGQDDTIMDAVVDTVRQNFARYNVSISARFPGAQPANAAGAAHLFIGGFDGELFGIAENVDVFNAIPGDNAVIFSESFSPGIFSVTPSAKNLGLAIGNIAAHEAGHLLGLNHVNDPMALMDTGSPPSSFLLDQEFILARLHSSIFPIGSQDANLLLLETVGAAGPNQLANTLAAADQLSAPAPFGNRAAAKSIAPITKADLAFCFCKRCATKRIKTIAWRQYYGQ